MPKCIKNEQALLKAQFKSLPAAKKPNPIKGERLLEISFIPFFQTCSQLLKIPGLAQYHPFGIC